MHEIILYVSGQGVCQAVRTARLPKTQYKTLNGKRWAKTQRRIDRWVGRKATQMGLRPLDLGWVQAENVEKQGYPTPR